jgi:lactoylglutathione lyase
MAKAIHMMVRVLDDERSVRFYDDVFGLEVADRFDFDGFSLIYLRNAENDFEVELTVNRTTTEPYDLGNGYGHMAFVVDDLGAEHARIDALGYEPAEMKELHRDERLLARYFFIADPDGYKIEILERHGRYR